MSGTGRTASVVVWDVNSLVPLVRGRSLCAVARADVLAVYDNSRNDAVPQLIAERAEGQQLRVYAAGINPAVDKALWLGEP